MCLHCSSRKRRNIFTRLFLDMHVIECGVNFVCVLPASDINFGSFILIFPRTIKYTKSIVNRRFISHNIEPKHKHCLHEYERTSEARTVHACMLGMLYLWLHVWLCVLGRFLWKVAIAWTSSNLWAESYHINRRKRVSECIHTFMYSVRYIYIYTVYRARWKTKQKERKKEKKRTREKNQLRVRERWLGAKSAFHGWMACGCVRRAHTRLPFSHTSHQFEASLLPFRCQIEKAKLFYYGFIVVA